MCVGRAGVRGIRTSREVFLLLFLEFVNMFVLHGKLLLV